MDKFNSFINFCTYSSIFSELDTKKVQQGAP